MVIISQAVICQVTCANQGFLKIIDENGNIADHSATITTKQDRHPNSGNLYFDYPKNKLSKYRFLTPRECFLLMGFDENDYEK